MDPDLANALRDGLTLYIILAASIALHEFGHAKAADVLGDPLPRLQGRVTLNPLAHLDPIGTGLIPLLMIFLPILSGMHLPVALIGWGRPVQLSLSNSRTRVRDEVLTTLAGPGMNVLILLAVALAGGLACRIIHPVSDSSPQLVLPSYAILINSMLIAFNLIPLPPLDGSRLMRHIVGMSEETFMRLAMNSWWILLILINTNFFSHAIGVLSGYVANPFGWIMNLVAG